MSNEMYKQALLNFKELFEEGLITAEEYETKRKELLGLPSQAAQPTARPSAAVPMRASETLDDILSDLLDESPPPNATGGTAGPARASAVPRRPDGPRPATSHSAAADLDYFVDMLGGQEAAAAARPSAILQPTDPSAVGRASVGPRVAASTRGPPVGDSFLREEHTVAGHKGAVNAVECFGNYMFTGGADRTILVWDLSTMQVVQKLEGHEGAVSSLVVDDERKRLFSGGWDNIILVWDLSASPIRELRTVRGPTSYVGTLRLQRGWLLAGEWNGTVHVYDAKTLKRLDSLSTEHRGQLLDVLVHPASSSIITACQDKRILKWSADSFNFKDTLGEIGGSQHTDWVTSLALLSETRLLSGSRDRTLKVWDMAARHPVDIATITLENPVTRLVRRGRYIIAADSKGKLHVYHIEDDGSLKAVEVITAHRQWITSLLFVGDYLFTGSRDGTAKIWT